MGSAVKGSRCCTSTRRVVMAHSRPVRISVAEMKLYYIYSEWCSWLHSLAEGESWGPLRKGAHSAAWVLCGWYFVDERSGLPSSCVPFGPEVTRVGTWSTQVLTLDYFVSLATKSKHYFSGCKCGNPYMPPSCFHDWLSGDLQDHEASSVRTPRRTFP